MARPRPVLTSASITGAIQGVAGVLAFLGLATQASDLNGEAQGIGSAVIALVTVGGNVIHGLHAQSKVTPVADPVAPDGTKLVPVTALVTSEPVVAVDVLPPAPEIPDLDSPVVQDVNVSAPTAVAVVN